MKRIICIGNRFREEDAAGPAVYDFLMQQSLPPDVEVIDGGLAGLNLLGFFEGAERVALVDSVSGFSGRNGTMVLEPADLAPLATTGYDHAAGLPYLLRVLPAVMEQDLPRIVIIGVEGITNEAVIADAAKLALQQVAGG